MKSMPAMDTPVPGRLCWLCQHCFLDQAEYGYSEYAPGSNFSLECLKRYWQLDIYNGDKFHLRDCITNAERCADFLLHESIKPEGRS